MTDDVVIRRALEADIPGVARLAGELVRMHHAADPSRFLLVDGVEAGYARWLMSELARPEAVVIAAVRGAGVVGYTYGALKERDWNLLLDEHGALLDVYVAAEARRAGVGKKLVQAMVAELERLGAPRVVLSTMVGNAQAQALFKQCGFRSTMLEMTRDSTATT